MIFYHATDADGRLHILGTQADARAINKHFEQIDVPTSKQELMEFIQTLYDERDHIIEEPTPELQQLMQAPPHPEIEDFATRSVRFDDEFDNMSLALQLHYAAKAMENARERL